MKLESLKALQPGDPVRWQSDENGDVINGTVQEIVTDSETVEDWDSILVCVGLDGVPQELYAGELV